MNRCLEATRSEPVRHESSRVERLRLERVRHGQRPDPEQLVTSLRPRLERLARYYARRTGQDADDLLQEAWVGLLEALPQVNPSIGSAEHFLLQRARWRMLDAIKRSHARRLEPLDEVDHPAADGLADQCVAAADVEQFERGLKATQRDVLACLAAGLTWREAGRELGCTSANIAYHVRQIKAQYEVWSNGGRPVAAVKDGG